jgi:hypothetical protein
MDESFSKFDKEGGIGKIKSCPVERERGRQKAKIILFFQISNFCAF